MNVIKFADYKFECKRHENLLDAFFRNKIEVPFSCRNGTCQACLTQVVSGKINGESQVGLSAYLKDSKHILPCKCYPISDMELAAPSLKDIYATATITSLKKISTNIIAVSLKPTKDIAKYKTGQFANIKTMLDNKIRSYSLTSQYNKDNQITFHVQKIADGTFSSWIFTGAKIGDMIQVHYPLGACFASNNNTIAGKLLIATGSGLGATVAIAIDALESGYTGQVHLYHACSSDSELYLVDELHALENKYANFKYTPCVWQQKSELGSVISADINELAFAGFQTLQDWEVYLYGSPKIVKLAIEKAISKDCEQDNIFCDAFEYGQTSRYKKSAVETDQMEFIEEQKRQFKPDEKMWEALKQGELLNKILHDFYNKVLIDPLLSPFFKGVTKSHIIGKQYAFFNQIYTGKDCYFGDRPRNAHHWMIISDSLFDHREKLFADSCIKCGLAEPFLRQFLALNESYRQSMVKTKVWPRISDGEIKPIKGFAEMILDIGSLCDGCEKELAVGSKVHYHDRTGDMFCEECQRLLN